MIIGIRENLDYKEEKLEMIEEEIITRRLKVSKKTWKII